MKQPRRKKVVTKEHTFSIRMSEKVRYALDLLARRHHSGVSTIVMKSLFKTLEEEKLTTREEGEVLSLFDRLWSTEEPKRVVSLAVYAPELLTDDERDIIAVIMRSPTLWHKGEELPSNYQGDPDWWATLRGGLVDMHWVGLFWERIVQAARKEIPEPDFAKLAQEFWDGVPKTEFSDDDFDVITDDEVR